MEINLAIATVNNIFNRINEITLNGRSSDRTDTNVLRGGTKRPKRDYQREDPTKLRKSPYECSDIQSGENADSFTNQLQISVLSVI